MEIVLENERLRVGIKSKGAELFSVVEKRTELEYMWNGDPVFWGKTSPVLFPIVGTLKGDTYLYKNKTYKLSRHGFARDSEFQITESSATRAVFRLRHTTASLLVFPFEFQFDLTYTLVENSLHVTYNVRCEGQQEMYFSVGGHPAFKVPLVTGSRYEDHYLQFSKTENAGRWPISKEGLIESTPLPFLNDSVRVDLTRTLFNEDAIVLKHLRSDYVSLRSGVHGHGLDFHFSGFPFLGIWAAKNADFVCIEPWCGIADAVTHDQQLVYKEGIEKLKAGADWSREWRVNFY